MGYYWGNQICILHICTFLKNISHDAWFGEQCLNHHMVSVIWASLTNGSETMGILVKMLDLIGWLLSVTSITWQSSVECLIWLWKWVCTLSFFSLFSINPSPCKRVCVRQHALSGDFKSRERKKKTKHMLRLLTHGIYFRVHILDYKRIDWAYETRVSHFWREIFF